jgi:hypothetical protein
MCQTDIVGAGRNKPAFDPVMAKIALLGDTLGRVKVNGIIRAGLDAVLAPGAQIIIHNNDSVESFVNSRLGASIGAGGLITVSAPIDFKNKTEFPIDCFGAVFCYRNEFDAVRRAIFLFAGHFAGLATPAGLMINFQRIACHAPPL